ncbi:ABC-F family ATP-binding cassette domain-containing protein [Fusobacterium ulcerans]|uniref:ABC-F family ATP-binding cassette domain-containing protein n=1 Tax=Fusobacterium ulcerans TaxID=861 RepID=UPI000E4750B1|nr:ABC-F family ATP-binding cassette domain-containing protein [Fusobacterium ulcerans]MCB8565683.1 ATP-binding cassette domain-containing protein [Fusobacterium ulcerans]MCB8649576.1 ATP-binding cassette domain-containing protein [Fusobacterium ulcerans]MEE0138638.1 ABC-F family ATP-binding cassette domain-containing protein [Fusobacterium ulcerans]RGY63202.1 ABC transporter ATP-binding protein [Fusobacterium ulcerans]
MALLQVNNLFMGFTGETLFKNISFSIDERDKIGMIGVNGAGKSTLIKILLGLEYDEVDPETNQRGTISKKGGLKIGYLSQHPDLNPDNTVFEELMTVFSNVQNDYHRIQELNVILAENLEDFDKTMEELGTVTARYEQNEGYAIEYKVKQILNGLTLAESLWASKISDLSGGQLSRVALGKILLEEPELLILDEPTNHLDLNAIEWLERILKDYKKAFILISHDVYFLDNVVNRVFEIEGKTLKTYNGNYTDFTIQKEAYLSGAVKAFDKEQDKLRKMEEFIRRYKAGVKSKQARGREKILNRMDKMENPVITTKKIKLKFETDTTSVDLVLRIKDLAKSFDGKEIFSNLNLDIYRGDRIGVIGKNGVGKSTLLKIINGMEKQSKGDFKIGDRVKIGYYDQNHQGLNPKRTVLEELMYHFVLSEEEARNICGGFLFTEDDVYKEISSLSGGEKARVAFMKLMLEKPNFLILDEPTNHLDIYSREILSESLEEYTGTILVVSHDRNFLDCVVNNIYEVKKDGAVLFKGDYNSYLNQREEVKEKDVKASLNFEEQKKNKNRISSLEKKIIKAEADVEKLEEKKSAKEEEYNKAGIENNVDKLMDIQKELEELDMEILSLMEEWENLENELKTLKNTF